MKRYKVALIHNIISPYRVPFFEKLANHPFIDLSVYFCAKTHKHRMWDIQQSNKYKYKILSGVTLEFAGIQYHINPSIILKLIGGDYDIIIINGAMNFTMQISFIISRLLKIPIILWSEGIESSQSLVRKIIDPIIKYVIRKVDAIVVPGTKSRDFHITQGANPRKIFIAPNIIDNEFFIKQSAKFRKDRKKIKKNLAIQNKKIILYVGQLIKRKGVKYLIDAYEKLKKDKKDICLIIVGDGPEKNELEQRSKRTEDIYFMGWVSEEEKIKYYSISDLFILPTLQDVWGLVINEAMCLGLPVISTYTAGASFDLIMQGKNGFVVEEANTEQLHLAMKKILSDEKLAKRMGKKSLEIIKNKFTIDNMVEGFVKAIEYAKHKQVK